MLEKYCKKKRSLANILENVFTNESVQLLDIEKHDKLLIAAIEQVRKQDYMNAIITLKECCSYMITNYVKYLLMAGCYYQCKNYQETFNYIKLANKYGFNHRKPNRKYDCPLYYDEIYILRLVGLKDITIESIIVDETYELEYNKKS